MLYKQSKEKRVDDYFKEYKRKSDLTFEERVELAR